MNKYVERLYNGIIKENPTLILMLGMCPTLAVTTSSVNGLGMGLTTMIVLAASNFMISFLRKIIPERMRIPSYIVYCRFNGNNCPITITSIFAFII